MSEFDTAEEFFAKCAELHNDEQDPEYMFQDFECFPERMYSESMGAEDIQAIIDYAKLDNEQRELLEAYIEVTGYKTATYEQADEALYCVLDLNSLASTEAQMGEYVADNGLLDIPEELANYIDYEAIGRDYLMDLSEHNGYVFNLN